MYNIRLKLAFLFFKWGKQIHPDIAKLSAEIKLQRDIIEANKILFEPKLGHINEN